MKKDISEIKSDYKKKIELIKKYNKSYYNNDNPLISDSKFDELKNEVIKLENKNSFLKKEGSVKEIIGAKPTNKFRKIKHLKSMLSLSNAFNIADMKGFLSKINNFLNKKIKKFNFLPSQKSMEYLLR